MKRRIPAMSVILLIFFALEVTAQTPKNVWTRTESPNFTVISNASSAKAQKTAEILERLEAVYTTLFPEIEKKRIPTNALVFADEAEWRNFKPLRSDGTPTESVAALFQSGADTPYIASSAEGAEEEFTARLGHELAHSVVERKFQNEKVPLWLGEGLAEYLEAVQIDAQNRLVLGANRSDNAKILRRSPLLPLGKFLTIDRDALRDADNSEFNNFYAQSWAFVHFLVNHAADYDLHKIGLLLDELAKKTPLERAFATVYGADTARLETEFRQYLASPSLPTKTLSKNAPILMLSPLKTSDLAQSETDAYLGDLLMRLERRDDAEKYLKKSLAAAPNAPFANLVDGNLKFEKQDYAGARKAFAKASGYKHRSYLLHFRTAYALARLNSDDEGNFQSYENAAQIRAELLRAIVLKPDFLDSYKLLANVSYIEEDFQKETLALIEKLPPDKRSDGELLLSISKLHFTLDDFAESRRVLLDNQKILQNEGLKDEAERWLAQLSELEKHFAEFQKQKLEAEQRGDSPPIWLRNPNKIRVAPLTPAESARHAELSTRRAIEAAIHRMKIADEETFIGKIKEIDCRTKGKVYVVGTTKDSSAKFSAQSMDAVRLVDLVGSVVGKNVGCGVVPAHGDAVFIYHQAYDGKSVPEISAIIFVPLDFRFLTQEEKKEEESLNYRALVLSSQKDTLSNRNEP